LHKNVIGYQEIWTNLEKYYTNEHSQVTVFQIRTSNSQSTWLEALKTKFVGFVSF